MSFATAEDVGRRLGRSLTTSEADQVDMLLELVTGLAAQAAGKDSDWADALTPVPALVRVLCIEAVVRVLQNPGAVRSESEQLGQFQRSVTYAATSGGSGLVFTESEERRIRAAIFGTSSATTMPGTTVDQAIELVDSGEITLGA